MCFPNCWSWIPISNHIAFTDFTVGGRRWSCPVRRPPIVPVGLSPATTNVSLLSRYGIYRRRQMADPHHSMSTCCPSKEGWTNGAGQRKDWQMCNQRHRKPVGHKIEININLSWSILISAISQFNSIYAMKIGMFDARVPKACGKGMLLVKTKHGEVSPKTLQAWCFYIFRWTSWIIVHNCSHTWMIEVSSYKDQQGFFVFLREWL